MDKNGSEGNELWRLLQGDSPLPEAEAEDGGEVHTAAPPIAATGTGTKQPPRRAPVQSFPDPEWRDDPETLSSQPVNPGSDNFIAQDSNPIVPVSTDTSQLQKILAADVDDDFEYRPSGQEQHGDVDIAVKAFNRMQDEVIHCKRHQDREAAAQCPVCQAFHCQDCLIVRRGKLICRDCAEAEYAPTEEEIFAALEMGLEAPPADTQITEKERPEFEIGGSLLGGEGRPSNPLAQLLAWALDIVVMRALILAGVFLLGGMFKDNAHPILQVLDGAGFAAQRDAVVQTLLLGKPWLKVLPVLMLLDFLYQFVCLAFFNRTLGMGWVGLRIVTEWGDFAGFGAAAARSAVSTLLLGAPSILVGAFMPDFRGLHDLAAGTSVINYNGLKRVDAYETIAIKRG